MEILLFLNSILVIISIGLTRKFLNPLTFFNFIFTIAILFALYSDFVNNDISQNTIGVYSLSFIFFNLSFLLLNNRPKLETFRKKKNIATIINFKSFHLRTIYILFYFVIFCYLLFLFHVNNTIGLSNYFTNILQIEEESISDSANLIVRFFVWMKKSSLLLSVLSTFYLIKYKEKKLLVIITILLSLLVNIGQRRDAVIYILLFVFLVFLLYGFRYMARNKFQLIVFLTFGVIVFPLFFIISQQFLNKEFNVVGSIASIPVDQSIVTITSYFFGNLKATDLLLADPLSTPIFGHSLRYFYLILNRLSIFSSSTNYAEIPFVGIPFPYNTVSLQYYVFSEGSYLWLILFYSFLGFFGKVIYKIQSENNNFIIEAFYVFFIASLFLSIRQYTLMYLEFIVYLIFLFFIYTIKRFTLK